MQTLSGLLLICAVGGALSWTADRYMDQILQWHNDYRRREGGTRMWRMEWDQSLANYADQWMQGCNFANGNDNYGENYGFYYGNDDMDNMQQAFQDWYNEREFYSYNNNNCGWSCRYTQMVWYNNRRVGCAINRCPSFNAYGKQFNNAWFFGCWYDPKGNFGNEFPYYAGEACSQCMNDGVAGNFGCDNGLCYEMENNMEMNMNNFQSNNINWEGNQMEMNSNWQMNNMNNMNNWEGSQMNNFESSQMNNFEGSQMNNFDGGRMNNFEGNQMEMSNMNNFEGSQMEMNNMDMNNLEGNNMEMNNVNMNNLEGNNMEMNNMNWQMNNNWQGNRPSNWQGNWQGNWPSNWQGNNWQMNNGGQMEETSNNWAMGEGWDSDMNNWNYWERDGRCYDWFSNCMEYSSNGDCQNYPYYMRRYCRKSCGWCGNGWNGDWNFNGEYNNNGNWGPCEDRYDNCQSYFYSCQSNNMWMSANCKRTCGYCEL